MLRVVTLGSVVAAFAVGIAAGAVAYAQGQPTAEPCAVAARPGGTPTAEGVTFSGAAGEQVTEAFALPEGTILFTFEMADAGRNVMNLIPAPGSDAAGNELIVNESDEGASGTGATSVYVEGEFILEVESVGPWSVSFEY